MQTKLNLLTPDGPVEVAFDESLNDLQYAFLINASKRDQPFEAFRRRVERWAKSERLTVHTEASTLLPSYIVRGDAG
jgi:hypothetical protein